MEKQLQVWAQIYAFQSAKIKRCFEIIFYYFTILGFKNVKKKAFWV